MEDLAGSFAEDTRNVSVNVVLKVVSDEVLDELQLQRALGDKQAQVQRPPHGNEQRSKTRLARAQTVRGQEREQSITRGRQAARTAALRAGLSPADADDIASHFVLSFLRRVPDQTDDLDQDAAPTPAPVQPSHLLPLFLRCEISRFRARVQRAPTSPDLEADYPDSLCVALHAQTEQQGEQRALWEAVAIAIWELPHLQRVVLVAFVLNDEPLALIASQHAIGEHVAKQAVCRARRALRRSLCAWHEK